MKFRLIKDEPTAHSPAPAEGPTATVEAINAVWGEISRFGVKTTPDGKSWVIHARTGEAMLRERAVPYGFDKKDNVIYLAKGEEPLKPHEIAKSSVWRNP